MKAVRLVQICVILGLCVQDAFADDPEKTWVDDGVTIHTTSSPEKRQDFEITILAHPTRVWRALATPEGVKEYMPVNAKIELRPGGAYQLFPGSTNRVLSFIPGKLLITSGSAPPQFPEVRKGGTWGIFWLDPIDGGKATRLR